MVIGSQIKELNQRLENIHKEADRFKFNINLGSNPEPRKLTDAERSVQKTTSEFNESAIVGEKIEQDTTELAQLLTTGSNQDIKVVSIVGTVGMGKTTLAQKIFNETTVQEHFKVKIWLSITQHFDDSEMLRAAIEHAGGDHGGTRDKTLLTRTLTNTLSSGRSLIVLDDMWSDQAWSHVLRVPIRNASLKQPGNWVLITTRFGDLAQRMGASFYQHHVKPLNDEDAWSLLNKQLPHYPNQLTTISGLSRLHKIRIVCCPKLEVFQDVPRLRSLGLRDPTMETLPGYMLCINPRYLDLGCGKRLYESLKKKASVGCFQPLLFCLKNPVFAHKIGSQIKELNQRLENIHKEADRFKFNINLGSNPEPRKLTDAERSVQKTTSEFNESAIVGEKIEQDTRELVQLLITSDNHDIKMLSVVGTGGMGKTTLAQKIFNDSTVREHFKVKVWLSITQHFDETELLRTSIEHAGGVHGGAQDKTLLTRTLTETLSTGRFLLVLDDMWSDQAWSHILSVPIRNASLKKPGNWVLITTRFRDLAQRMGASFYQHHVKPLNDEDAWSLLNKQLPPYPLIR
nr:unnamed protein product [Digitaria exilis]